MHASITRFEGSSSPDRIDAAIKLIQEKTIPETMKIPGFKGCYWCLDREVGKGMAMSLWESREARLASEQRAGQLRQELKQELRVPAMVLAYYEVVGQA